MEQVRHSLSTVLAFDSYVYGIFDSMLECGSKPRPTRPSCSAATTTTSPSSSCHPPPAYQRRPNPPAPARAQTAACGSAQTRQPSANTQAPATPRTRQGTGRGRTAGTRNWTIDEDIALVDAVADYRLIGKRMWEELVTPEYQSNAEIMGLPSRDTNALIARWKKVWHFTLFHEYLPSS